MQSFRLNQRSFRSATPAPCCSTAMRKRSLPAPSETSGDDVSATQRRKSGRVADPAESKVSSVEEQREKAKKWAEENLSPVKTNNRAAATPKTEVTRKEAGTVEEQRRRAAEWAAKEFGTKGPKRNAEDALVSENEAVTPASETKKRNVRRKTISTLPIPEEKENEMEVDEREVKEAITIADVPLPVLQDDYSDIAVRRSSRRKSTNSTGATHSNPVSDVESVSSRSRNRQTIALAPAIQVADDQEARRTRSTRRSVESIEVQRPVVVAVSAEPQPAPAAVAAVIAEEELVKPAASEEAPKSADPAAPSLSEQSEKLELADSS